MFLIGNKDMLLIGNKQEVSYILMKKNILYVIYIAKKSPNFGG